MTASPVTESRAQVFAEIWDEFERGRLIVQCAWCRSVRIDEQWVLAPRAALAAIDARLSLSHSICPTCASAASRDLASRANLNDTTGFLVSDRRGRVIGHVEAVMHGSSQHTPDALAVRFSIFRWRRLLVRLEEIAEIDRRTRVIGLRVNRDQLAAFL